MAADMPYTQVPGKIPELFKKISDAKVPDSFTHAFLKDTLGFKSTNDRTLAPLLKALGFIDQSGKPTPRYRELKNNSTKGAAIASGVKDAYSSLFESNENANLLTNEEVKGLVSQIAGTDKDLTTRITSTFLALVKESDFTKTDEKKNRNEDTEDETESEGSDSVSAIKAKLKNQKVPSFSHGTDGFRPDFCFNIQIHLPNNGTEETYLNIFNAIRDTFR